MLKQTENLIIDFIIIIILVKLRLNLFQNIISKWSHFIF